ncbi:4-hydroxy-3-methylbut-2-enyl diphosphate reductase [Candidatus Fokinia crypta]|uniref:4-hydroxy-3-methylbut-2-enyl diphosphate reductase n=1 Tax=Candidatus Fokinia crypta TaxID=1920990 RepID=A0ABZ0UNK5_9RICK|nr:4-hydroxy-3-methylbut-2-enyl diphosphate reductase [Candidatus Fokinia cryptica]WPX97701.1 4-hydroxy-3-methylbut-2-enyl diphosphate reductase [Candidatus Fokinia cryptica]
MIGKVVNKVILARPSGFCAGVRRAVEILDKCLEMYGTPLYVKHKIVHNQRVVADMEKRGVIFVENIEEVPYSSNVVFSAHGVSKEVEKKAEERKLRIIDATCPLVKKVHKKVEKISNSETYELIVIGSAKHPEIIGTIGRIPEYVRYHIISSIDDAKSLSISNTNVRYITQTTLSLDETQEIVKILEKRFSSVEKEQGVDICYATQNRQDGVKKLIEVVDVILVIGSAISSNSNSLVKVGSYYNKKTFLIDSLERLEALYDTILYIRKCMNKPIDIGITAGASTPDVTIAEIVNSLQKRYKGVKYEELDVHSEDGIIFKISHKFYNSK